ncbi:hypothetical protein AALB51_07745 [Lachnospiraceae bacterium 62-26]
MNGRTVLLPANPSALTYPADERPICCPLTCPRHMSTDRQTVLLPHKIYTAPVPSAQETCN